MRMFSAYPKRFIFGLRNDRSILKIPFFSCKMTDIANLKELHKAHAMCHQQNAHKFCCTIHCARDISANDIFEIFKG